MLVIAISFERSLRTHSEIDSSVCTTIFKQIAGLCSYPKYLMLYINEFVSTIATTKWTAVFKVGFELLAENQKIFK